MLDTVYTLAYKPAQLLVLNGSKEILKLFGLLLAYLLYVFMDFLIQLTPNTDQY